MTAARQQNWSAGSYDTHARFVSDLAGPVLAWLSARPGERILDLGCGDGVITAALRRGGDMALAGPWFYPSAGEYRTMLEAGGFTVRRIGLYPRPTPLKTGMGAWLTVMRKPFLDQFGPEKDTVLREVEDLLAPALRDRAGNWTADYVRLRVEAVKA